MASRPRGAPRKQTPTASISAASSAYFSYLSSSDGSSNDAGSSDFSSDDDTPAQGPQTSTSACRALDFFLLFFTTEVTKTVCENTNKYAWMNILGKQTYSRRDGSWEEVTPLEMLRLIGLIIYMGLVEVRRDRFFALLAFLNVGDPEDAAAAAAASDGK
ncbi:hypothetical protein HPB52_016332 [Rhipicephalus sanguineus]|uniref:PiggyBac transposable element-derived protein domain-containing protein n=1 Tax=Rhipicephalus sanguineus TaxID=34632 RepID=A0A9D4PCP3_RHISA|nr:hypothetical protein HPB52_016332 [Rhipicephalus sanguineus]